MKKTYIAYLLWFVGGWYGLHHFYLRRYRQAFVWFSTLGGFYFVGWITDIFKIPRYVAQANESSEYLLSLKERKRRSPKQPPFSLSQFIEQIIVAGVWGGLYLSAIPDTLFGWKLIVLKNLTPVMIALGMLLFSFKDALFVPIAVHTVGNMEDEEGGLFWPMLGSYLYHFIPLDFTFVTKSSISSAVLFQIKAKQWPEAKAYHGLCYHSFMLLLFGIAYLSLFGSYLYFNSTVTDHTGVPIHLRDAVKNFFESQAWREFWENLKQLYRVAQYHGWYEVWIRLKQSMDPLGESQALKILGLSEMSSEKEKSSRYRELSRKFHPDKYTDPIQKEWAHKKFLEIQEAYSKLSNIKHRRDRHQDL